MSMEKLVLVTGSGRGLGATIAQTFADQNFQVAINYSKSKDQAETLPARRAISMVPFFGLFCPPPFGGCRPLFLGGWMANRVVGLYKHCLTPPFFL